jgi:cell wall-associated NlpC family hydrolase
MLLGGAVATSAAATASPMSARTLRFERMYRGMAQVAGAEVQEGQAARAIAAARSQIGVPYVYLSSRPGVGFDCSGLTMYAWGRAGVRLPHSSADQYATVRPRISRANLRPGDLLFFYSPVHHVAIYLGHGMMIHAPHSGQRVEIARVYWQYFVGAARPGL